MLAHPLFRMEVYFHPPPLQLWDRRLVSNEPGSRNKAVGTMVGHTGKEQSLFFCDCNVSFFQRLEAVQKYEQD
eukprot:1155681-Pelagomonas_calceolata.AAC.8